MATQTTYSSTMSAARAGMIADMRGSTLISRTVEDATLGFGAPVTKGTAAGQCKKLAAGSTDIIGITVRERSGVAESSGWAQYEDARIMSEGALWVTVTDAGGVAAGDPVWVKKSDGTFSNADAGSGGSLKVNGRFETAAANGALAVIVFNCNVPAVAGA